MLYLCVSTPACAVFTLFVCVYGDGRYARYDICLCSGLKLFWLDFPRVLQQHKPFYSKPTTNCVMLLLSRFVGNARAMSASFLSPVSHQWYSLLPHWVLRSTHTHVRTLGTARRRFPAKPTDTDISPSLSSRRLGLSHLSPSLPAPLSPVPRVFTVPCTVSLCLATAQRAPSLLGDRLCDLGGKRW